MSYFGAPGAAGFGLEVPAAPAGAVPAGAVPAGAVPAGAVPAGAVPAEAVPAEAEGDLFFKKFSASIDVIILV